VTGEDGIQITVATGVTIDLNGFTLRGVSGSLDGIRALSEVEEVVVRNGAVVEWGGDGIDLEQAQVVEIDRIEARFNRGRGIASGSRTLLTNCVVAEGTIGPRTAAIDLDPESVLTNCTTVGYGIGIFLGTHGIARDCVVADARSTGVRVQAGATVTGCSVSGVNELTDPVPSAVGIEAGEDSRISGNSVDGVICGLPCVPIGINVVGAGARVDDNAISDTSRAILSSGGATIFGNTMSGIALAPAIVGQPSDDIGPLTTADDAAATAWANIVY
jgi:hypothetical protein